MAKLAVFINPEVGKKIRLIENRAWVPKDKTKPRQPRVTTIAPKGKVGRQ